MMNTMNGMGGIDTKALYETWEKATTAYFDAWTKSPAFLAAMGKTMEAQLGVKANYDKFIQQSLEAWRIPTAKDMESVGDRLASLEERMAAVEEHATVGAKK